MERISRTQHWHNRPFGIEGEKEEREISTRKDKRKRRKGTTHSLQNK
jgi:hypothetical protein